MEKKLYCSTDKKICGVCGGIADYFNIDPTLVRFLVAEIAFFTAIVPAFLVYLIVAVVVPQAPADYGQTHVNTAKRITRSNDKKIAGVCGGIAEYFQIDSTIIRLLFVALFLFVGNGLYTYLFGAIFMPPAPQVATAQDYAAYTYQNPAPQPEPQPQPEAPASEQPAAGEPAEPQA